MGAGEEVTIPQLAIKYASPHWWLSGCECCITFGQEQTDTRLSHSQGTCYTHSRTHTIIHTLTHTLTHSYIRKSIRIGEWPPNGNEARRKKGCCCWQQNIFVILIKWMLWFRSLEGRPEREREMEWVQSQQEVSQVGRILFTPPGEMRVRWYFKLCQGSLFCMQAGWTCLLPFSS